MSLDVLGRSPSRVGFASRDEFTEGDTSHSSISSTDTDSDSLLATIPEKPYSALSPPPKRKSAEDLDEIWFRSHLAEVIELDMFHKGCPYFRHARLSQWPKSVIRDITHYVNICEDKEK